MAQKNSRSISSSLKQLQTQPQLLQSSQPTMIAIKDVQKMIKEIMETMDSRFADLNAKMDQTVLELTNQMEQNVHDLKAQIKRNNDEIREDVIFAFSGLSENLENLINVTTQIQDDNQKLAHRIDKLEDGADEIKKEQLILEYDKLEFALRLRGLREIKNERLQLICADAFAILLQMDSKDVYHQIQKVYRVNSRIAKQRNLPRDVVIYFERKNLRNAIAQTAFNQKFMIHGQEVRVLKEIPLKMRKLREEYKFLTEELKERNLRFRWDVPIGVILNYSGKRYCLNSVQEAEEFYLNVLQAREVCNETGKPQPIVLKDPGGVVSTSMVLKKQVGKRLDDFVVGRLSEPKRRGVAEKMEKSQQDVLVFNNVTNLGGKSLA